MKELQQEFDAHINIDSIHEHPDNPRKGDDRAVGESIARNGFFGAVLVQRSTGNIVAGNTRYRVMRDEGRDFIPGFWLDCDDETATRILLADNRTSDLAFYDDDQLFELLRSLVESEGLDGTGYDRAAYELLLQSVESDAIVGGIRQGVYPEERIDQYNALDIRSLILPYEFERYELVANDLARLRLFLRDGGVLRLNWLAARTSYMSGTGGLQDYRTAESNAADARRLADAFPGITRYVAERGKRASAEVELRRCGGVSSPLPMPTWVQA